MSDPDPRPDRGSERAAQGFSTRAIQAASRAPRLDQTPTSVPIYQTATFASGDADELGRVAADPRAGYAYSRISNPTTAALGSAYAELAGGEAGLALASGMGAIHAALASLLRAGDRVVAPVALYGSTRALLLHTFGGFGVRVDFVDTTDLGAVADALTAAPTRVLYAETIANPTTYLADHAALAELAHRHGARYVVDNTFASPYVCRPLELGTDLVVESATKFLGGHSDLIAGVVAGPRELIVKVERVQIDTGATLGPLEAFLVLRGILTLAVRAERHARTAAALAAWLERQEAVRSVLYPGLPSHPQHDVAGRQFRPGVAGGMLAFEVHGGREAGRAVIDSLRLPELTASLGSVHTMVVHPPSTSHRQSSESELLEAGITPGLLRVSVGLEDLEDLQADFSAALAEARAAVPAEGPAATRESAPAIGVG
ncbi:MAG: aminotransferase class I/II-fold pyridoxal phosphate-dependent enzyme [Candidatus Limnocylindrales bacterium]|nr:aminotransferase class I/II-fold pyridoxal phosphate-dependent enzyme [Candidatus Limnocylindrales bacterium]